MANGSGQNFGSVLFQSLAKGVQGVQQGLQEKRQNDLQNLMTVLQVDQNQRDKEAFLTSQQLRQQQIQNAELDFKSKQLQLLDMTKSPAEKAKEQAEAQRIAQEQFVLNNLPQDLPGLNILQGVGVENNLQPLNPQDVSQMGYEALSRIRPTIPPGSELETPFGKISVPREDQLALAGLRGEKTETEKLKRDKIIADIDMLSEKLLTESVRREKMYSEIDKLQAEVNIMKDPIQRETAQAKLDKVRAETESTIALKELRNQRAKYIASGAMSAKEQQASARRAKSEAGKALLNEANILFRESFKEDVFKDIGIGGINSEQDLSKLIVYLNESGGTIDKRFSLIPDEKKPELIKQFSDYFDKIQAIDAGDVSPGISGSITLDSLPNQISFDGSMDDLLDSLGVQ